MAYAGQLLELNCEMPKCYYHKGRGSFDTKTHPPTNWAPSADHYPVPKTAGGQLKPWNVRLAHVMCNREDYGWRTRINTLLRKGESLEGIAEDLNPVALQINPVFTLELSGPDKGDAILAFDPPGARTRCGDPRTDLH